MTNLGSIGLGVVTLAAALGFYMSSYMVSAERERIEDLSLQIAADQSAMERLNAELGVRASLARLEDINDKVWALQPPRSSQIVEGGTQLAALLPPLETPEEGKAELLYASAEAAPLTRAPEPSGRVQLASLGVESIARAERPARAEAAPRLQRAAYVPEGRGPASRFSEARADSAPAPAKVPAQPQLTGAPAEDLFSDDFLAEVETTAALERAGFQKVALR